MNSPRIPKGLQTFLDHAESLHPSNNPKRENGFAKEFMQLKALSSQLKTDPEYSCHHGELECNRPKNRYKDIVPFDYNRIILPTIPGVSGSDYINGNYVKGPDGTTSYLALQGPLPRTVNDFWRLIASHRCQVVIMVCKEVEMGKLKCKRYWPETQDEKLHFAGLEISLVSEHEIAEGFVMRTMKMKSDQEEMMVTQLQYTAWPDHDVPKSATPLIEMNKTLSGLQGSRKQQVLIHCSAGCGRTGTICAVDYAWTLLKIQKTDNFSVFDIVANLRRQRMAMVQTKEQYALVYKAVVHLVNEELEREKLQSHTYVNVASLTDPISPQENSNYENCEFFKSAVRWKQNDKQNVSVPRAPLADPKETKRAADRDGSWKDTSANPGAGRTNEYVNLEIPSRNEANGKSAVAAVGSKPVVSVKPSLPQRDSNKAVLNYSAMKSGVQAPLPGRQQTSPTFSDYNSGERVRSSKEVVANSGAGRTNDYVSLEISNRNEANGKFAAFATGNKPTVSVKPSLPQRDSNKPVLNSNAMIGGAQASLIGRQQTSPVVSDYEIPFNKASDTTVPKLGNETATQKNFKKGFTSDYEVSPLSASASDKKEARHVPEVEATAPPGISSKRASSSPNVLDDMFLLSKSDLQLQNAVNVPNDSKAFRTLPNRLKLSPGPKRCPITMDAFEDSRADTGRNEEAGAYSFVGDVSPPVPTDVENPAFIAQFNQSGAAQKTNPSDKTTPKQVDKRNPCSPVGAYYLLGIPENASPIPVSVGSAPNLDLSKQNAGNPVQVEKKPGGTVEAKEKPVVEPSYEIVGQSWQQPDSKVSSPTRPTLQTGKAQSTSVSTGTPSIPLAAKRNAIGEPSYTLVGQPLQPPSKLSPPIPDGLPKDQSEGDAAHIVKDIYAVVAKPPSSPNLKQKAAGSAANLRNQSSSSSLKSSTSTSSDDLEVEGPPVPEKTINSYLAPGEEHYESVEQSTKATLGRLRKMIKSNSKSSFPKRGSEGAHVIPRSNSAGSSGGVPRQFEDIGYKKRVGHPNGPRACPRNWPQLNL